MNTPEFLAAIRAAMDANEGNRDAQVLEVAGIVAGVIEKVCRPDDRWGPKKRRERGEDRRTA